MNFTLHQLKVFSIVVEHESITKASETLHMTQPAVSIQIKNFQDQFELPLTEIIGRQLYVTDFGRRVYQIAQEILAKVDEVQYTMNAFSGLLSGKLKIATASNGKYVLPYYLSSFLKNYPHVELQIKVTNRQDVIDKVNANEVDFGLISFSAEDKLIDEEILMPNPLAVVSSTDYPLTVKSVQLTEKFMNDHRFIVREKGSGTRKVLQDYLNSQEIDLNVKFELMSNEAVKQSVIAGLGISVLPIVSLKNEIALNQVKIIHLDEFPIEGGWRLSWMKKRDASPLAKAFLEYIKEQKEAIIQEHFSWLQPYFISK